MHACSCVCVWVHGRERVLARVYPFLSSMQRSCAMLSAASLSPTDFSTLTQKRHDFREGKKQKVTEHRMRILIFSTTLILEIL